MFCSFKTKNLPKSFVWAVDTCFRLPVEYLHPVVPLVPPIQALQKLPFKKEGILFLYKKILVSILDSWWFVGFIQWCDICPFPHLKATWWVWAINNTSFIQILNEITNEKQNKWKVSKAWVNSLNSCIITNFCKWNHLNFWATLSDSRSVCENLYK